MFTPVKYFELDSKLELPHFRAQSVSGYLPEAEEIYPLPCPFIHPPPSCQVPFQIGMEGREGVGKVVLNSYSYHSKKA